MPNPLILQQIQQQPALIPKQKKLPGYFITAILMVAAGSWLNFFILGLRGFHLFQSKPIASSNLTLENFSPSVLYWEEQILTWADLYSLDPILIATVMQIESCGNPQVMSPAGAQGLFQVMPYHFNAGEGMLDPQTNALRGLTYLSEGFRQSDGDIERTLAGYNGGHGQIARARDLWPQETQSYVYWGMGIYREAVEGKLQGKTLKAWLAAGGDTLCAQASQTLGIR